MEEFQSFVIHIRPFLLGVTFTFYVRNIGKEYDYKYFDGSVIHFVLKYSHFLIMCGPSIPHLLPTTKYTFSNFFPSFCLYYHSSTSSTGLRLI